MKKFIRALAIHLAVILLLPMGAIAATPSSSELPIKIEDGRGQFKKFRQSRSLAPQFREDRILVRYKNKGKRFQVLDLPKGKKVHDAIREYSRLNEVEYAEPDYVAYADMIPNDTYYSPYQWHMDNATGSGVNAEQAWDTTTGSANVV